MVSKFVHQTATYNYPGYTISRGKILDKLREAVLDGRLSAYGNALGAVTQRIVRNAIYEACKDD